MKLIELLEQVKDRDLPKEQLEVYFDEVSYLISKLHLELAELEKQEALFIENSPEKSNIATKSKWKATDSGQREIMLKRYLKSAESLRGSIKNRIYAKL